MPKHNQNIPVNINIANLHRRDIWHVSCDRTSFYLLLLTSCVFSLINFIIVRDVKRVGIIMPYDLLTSMVVKQPFYILSTMGYKIYYASVPLGMSVRDIM